MQGFGFIIGTLRGVGGGGVGGLDASKAYLRKYSPPPTPLRFPMSLGMFKVEGCLGLRALGSGFKASGLGFRMRSMSRRRSLGFWRIWGWGRPGLLGLCRI